jgi:hypothetical protein
MSVSTVPPMAAPPEPTDAPEGAPEGGADGGLEKLIEFVVTIVDEILPSRLEAYIKDNPDKVLALLGISDESPTEELAESAEGLTATDTFADLEGEDVEEED